jgi:nucleoid DNA-binding protein
MTKPANLKDLIVSVAASTGLSQKNVTACINSLTREIESRLAAGQPVKMVGFVHFDTAVRRPRIARNPQTNAAVPVSEKRVVVFRAGLQLKQSVKNRSQDLVTARHK